MQIHIQRTRPAEAFTQLVLSPNLAHPPLQTKCTSALEIVKIQNQIDDQVYKFPHLILNQVELLEHIYIQQFKIDERKIKLFDDTANV